MVLNSRRFAPWRLGLLLMIGTGASLCGHMFLRRRPSIWRPKTVVLMAGAAGPFRSVELAPWGREEFAFRGALARVSEGPEVLLLPWQDPPWAIQSVGVEDYPGRPGWKLLCLRGSETAAWYGLTRDGRLVLARAERSRRATLPNAHSLPDGVLNRDGSSRRAPPRDAPAMVVALNGDDPLEALSGLNWLHRTRDHRDPDEAQECRAVLADPAVQAALVGLARSRDPWLRQAAAGLGEARETPLGRR